MKDEQGKIWEMKGTLTIVADTIKGKADFIYYFHEGSCGQHVIDALQDFGLDMGVFKVRAYSSGSFIEPYEPLWASFGSEPTFYLVSAVRGGGKRSARDVASKTDRLKTLKETVVKKASQIVIEPTAVVHPLTSVAQQSLEAFMKASDADALEAIENQIDKLTIAETDAIISIMESKTLSLDSKVGKCAGAFFQIGDIVAINEKLASLCETASSMLLYAVRKVAVDGKHPVLPLFKLALIRAKAHKEGRAVANAMVEDTEL
eukprot:Skav209743  [mRNA]  locus=scaffold2057:34849:35631:+ [translate_table: standard]